MAVVSKCGAVTAETQRCVTVLGSTGSIGCSTVDLLERSPDRFRVEDLTGNHNIKLLAEQARKLRPRFVATADPDGYAELKDLLSGTGIEVAAGESAVVEAASRSAADWVMAAIVGAAGLRPTLAAARRGATVALANKECLVCAGELMMAEVKRHGATLLPVDSEHNAIFQVMDFEQRDRIDRIILTASGGPFRTFTREQMAGVTPAQAVAHPNWDMGAKISVDSATMFNKGLELIEAYHLFGLAQDRIEILVHPQSVVHSLVAYCDGSVLAQLGSPDMRTPIAYTLAWPQRMPTPAKRLDLASVATLAFEAPDTVRFPALRLARHALQTGGAAPTIFNAANEIAVQSFLSGGIGFLDIAAIVEDTLSTVASPPLERLADVFQVDRRAREVARGVAAARLR